MLNEGKEGKHEKRSGKKAQQRALKVRLVPIWLRLLIVLFLLFASVLAGLVSATRSLVTGKGSGYYA